MRALIARFQRWLAERAELKRRRRAVQAWRNPFEDDQHEQVRDRILVIGLLGSVLALGTGANVIGIAAKASSLLGGG